MITALTIPENCSVRVAGLAYERQYPKAGHLTVVDGKVYHLNGDGDVGCFDAAGGEALVGQL